MRCYTARVQQPCATVNVPVVGCWVLDVLVSDGTPTAYMGSSSPYMLMPACAPHPPSCRSACNTVVPKLVSQDYALFASLLNGVFPGCQVHFLGCTVTQQILFSTAMFEVLAACSTSTSLLEQYGWLYFRGCSDTRKWFGHLMCQAEHLLCMRLRLCCERACFHDYACFSR